MKNILCNENEADHHWSRIFNIKEHDTYVIPRTKPLIHCCNLITIAGCNKCVQCIHYLPSHRIDEDKLNVPSISRKRTDCICVQRFLSWNWNPASAGSLQSKIRVKSIIDWLRFFSQLFSWTNMFTMMKYIYWPSMTYISFMACQIVCHTMKLRHILLILVLFSMRSSRKLERVKSYFNDCIFVTAVIFIRYN